MRFHPTGRNAPHSRLHMLTCDVSVALSLLSPLSVYQSSLTDALCVPLIFMCASTFMRYIQYLLTHLLHACLLTHLEGT